MAKMFDKVSQSFLDAIKGVMEAKKLDPVNPKALEGDFEDREDKDINNDGCVDKTDKYLHNRRKAIKKAVGESTDAYGKSMDKMRDDEKKKNISSSDKDKISRLAALMKAEKKPVKEEDESKEKESKAAEAKEKKMMKACKEEAEQIDEVSKATLGRYINKAKNQIDGAAWRTGYRQGSDPKADATTSPLLAKKEKQLSKRHKGIETAVNKLTKEESEIEEAYGMWKVEFPKQHAGKQVEAGSVHVKAQNTAHAHKVAAKRVGVDHKVFKSKVTKSSILPEEAEQIDEISTKLAINYTGKAADSRGHKNLSTKKLDKRYQSMALAHEKIRGRHAKVPTTEEVELETEDLHELSKGTLGRYIYKAANQVGEKGITAGLKIGDSEDSKKEFKTMGKRQKGIAKAVSKLAKEDQEFIDSLNAEMFEEIELEESTAKVADHLIKRYGENVRKSHVRSAANDFGVGFVALSHHVRKKLGVNRLEEARGRPKKAAAKDFTVHPKTGEKLMHNNPEHMKRIEKLQKNGILEKPKTEAGQHIINQLRKASTSMQGGATVHFTHGESKHVSAAHAGKALDKYASMKPSEKEDFQKKISHSHEHFMKHI